MVSTAAGPTRLLVCLALLAGAAAIGWASPPTPLPRFELTSLDAEAVPAASLVREGRWLLVYVSPYSGASGPLLQALEGTNAGPGPRLVIVVAAEAAAAKAMAKSFEGRLDAAWYADPSGGARRALGLTGVPVALGVNGEQIQWTLSGGVADRRTLRSILSSWR
jgi:hypothetical protein